MESTLRTHYDLSECEYRHKQTRVSHTDEKEKWGAHHDFIEFRRFRMTVLRPCINCTAYHTHLLQLRFVHIPNKPTKPLYSINMRPHTHPLIYSVYVAQPFLPRNPTGIPPEDVFGKIPIVPGICISRHDPRRYDDILAVERARCAREDRVWGDGIHG